MKVKALLAPLALTFLLIGCKGGPIINIEPLCQKEKPDGFVDSWTEIILTDPPPPAPFRFINGTPIDLNMVAVPTTGKESQVEATFTVAMGTVGAIAFNPGSAPGVYASTPRIERALNSWQFTNNGWGQIKATLNFGSKKVTLNFQKFKCNDRVDLLESSFYSAFIGRKGRLKIEH